VKRLVWLVTGLAIGAVLAGGAGYALQSSRTNASAPPESVVQLSTASVEQRTLESTEELDGTLGYSGEGLITNGLAGTVTRLPEEGQVLEQGDTILQVDGKPRSVLLYGDVPAWRTMRDGIGKGTDVKQLETALKALGYLGRKHVPDRDFNQATENAVEEWQEDLGVSKDGVVNLGEVVFQPGPVRIEGLELELGARANPGAPVATTTSATRVVTVELDADRQDILAVGDGVGIELPDGSETTGTVREIGSVATGGADGGTPSVTVTIELDDPASTGTLDGAPVTVNVVRDRRENVMAVPVESLLALREGGYAVQVVDGGGSHLVGVDLGLFEDGWVQVDGNLSVGDDVAVPS
jgi:peptidoglycan hydrolase-like protein with peptidoglycan-binding domain